MQKRTLAVLTGALLLAGGVAAIAAVGERGGHGHGGPGMMGRGGGWHHGQGMGGRERVLTKDEADARARERFARLDKDSNGFIDAAEIEAGLGARMASRPGPGGGQMGQRLIQRFDENRDGKVTKDEFTIHLKKRFAQADLDNDGKITDADLPPMMRGQNLLAGEGTGPTMGRGMGRRGGGHGGPMGGGMDFGWLRGANANKDGVITLDEALAKGLERFMQLDRNKDGTVEQADFDAMRKEMVDYRIKRFIHRYGADKDGKVSREQFLKEAAERFALADFDNDGRIGRGEMGPGGRHGRGGPGGFGGPDGDGGPRRGPGMMGPGPGGPGGPSGAGPGRN